MRILHVSHNYYPAIGGAEALIQNLSEGLVRRGHDVTVVTSTALSSESYFDSSAEVLPAGTERINGVTVVRLPLLRTPPSFLPIRGRVVFTFSKRKLPGHERLRVLLAGPYMQNLHTTATKISADVICATPLPFSHVYTASRVARRNRVPFVVIPCCHPQDDLAFDNALHYRLLAKADVVLAHTPYEKEHLGRWGVSPSRIHLGAIGIDPEAFTGAKSGGFRTKHNIPLTDKLVLFVGRQAQGKGLVSLLTAMRAIWEWDATVKLVIAGAETEYSSRAVAPEISRLPGQIQRNVTWLSNFTPEVKASLYRDCDVLALPSNSESFGIVFLEAWLCEKPVIGCDSQAVASVVTDGWDGILVPYGDAVALARSIKRLLENDDLRRTLGSRGYWKVLGEYTAKSAIDRVEALYSSLIMNHDRPGKAS